MMFRRALLLSVAILLAAQACAGPCDAPLTYRIGDLDLRFGLPRSQVLADLARAEAIWEDKLGRNLFAYAADGRMPVNFVYDDRQSTAQDNERRKNAIDTASGWGDALRADYEAARRRYETEKADLLSEQTEHEARVAAHNRTVNSWNARGGAPPAEVAALQRDQAALAVAAEALDKKRVAVNALAARANGLGERYNNRIREVQDNVAAINTTAGREFKQGTFTGDSKGGSIDIFEYTDDEDLVRVLAHEMGHALGLGHNDNPESVMYAKNSSLSATPTREDLAAVATRCGF